MRRWRRCLFLPLLLAGCRPAREGTVVIDGSATAFPVVNLMAEEFARAHPQWRTVANKCGTGGGFRKLAREEIDVAAASRPAEAGEAPADAVAVPIAFDGVTVVVNPRNPLRRLSLAQLRDAWRGRVDDWATLGGTPGRIAFYGPTEDHGTAEFFAGALGLRELRRDVQADPDYNVVIRDVAEDPNGIGYVGLDYYGENRDRLRALAIDGVSPTREAIAGGAYRPLTRPLVLYVRRRDLAVRKEMREFLRFALGPEGRAAVEEARYVPLPRRDLEAARRRLAPDLG